jgi:hypothetical protein
MFFIQLDISKAFDTVNWPYLLGIMTHIGLDKNEDWISALWCTSSSSVLLNEDTGKTILNCRGVKQGDPLSQMLFMMAMKPLHMLFRKAQEVGLLSKLSLDCVTFRVSLYVDAAAIFITTSKQDLQVTDCILQLFAQACGLKTNSLKTCYYPIQCDDAALSLLASPGRVLSTFPYTYLGLPLDVKKSTRASLQALVQKIAHRLPGWKKGLLTYRGRELLVKSVLFAMPTHFLTIFKLPKWTILGVDRYRRSFMWRGTDPENIRGRHCLVNWDTYLRPKKLGDLGIRDLENFNRALRLKLALAVLGSKGKAMEKAS